MLDAPQVSGLQSLSVRLDDAPMCPIRNACVIELARCPLWPARNNHAQATNRGLLLQLAAKRTRSRAIKQRSSRQMLLGVRAWAHGWNNLLGYQLLASGRRVIACRTCVQFTAGRVLWAAQSIL
jgi:hypothetical protein